MRKIVIFLVLLLGGKYSQAQVKLQTGSAETNIPIFSWEDDKSRLISSVSINYSSGNGLKVGDIPSNIGQGWHLQIGGSITRIQSGEPDDQKPRDGAYNDITKYPPGYLYDPLSASDGCPNDLTTYPIFKAKDVVYKQHNTATADKELDRFAFEMNGKSGVFFLGKNNGDKGILLGDSKLKIWFTRNESMPGIRTTIDAFYIQDENGIIYKFTNKQITKELKVRYSDANATAPLTQPEFKAGNVYHESSFDDGTLANPYIVNGWMLTEMEDVLTHRKIIFNYVNRNIDASSGTTAAYYSESGYSIITHSRSISQSPEISSMVYPDGHQITVNYGAGRFDFNGEYAIKSIDVQYGNRYLSKYELNTSYFIGNRIGLPESNYQKSISRLCLTSVKKTGVDLMSDDVPYMFDYYMGSSTADDIIPPLFSYRKDMWGYYNGDQTVSFHSLQIPLYKNLSDLSNDEVVGLCYLRVNSGAVAINPKAGFAKNGLLKKVYYPTGGSLKYEYEQNSGNLNGQYTNVGGVHVSRSVASDEGNNYNCDVVSLETNYNYINDGSSQSSVWGLETPINKYTTFTYYEPRKKKYHWGLHGCGILGCCKYQYKYPGILSRDQAIDLTGHQKFLEALSAVLDVVSLITTVVDVVVVALGATGFGAIAAVVIDAISAIYTLISTCTKDYSKRIWSNVFYDNDLNNNPLPVQFKRVEVAESSGQNGKTVYDFTSPDDYAIWEPSNSSMSNKQRFAYWAYGLPKKTTVLNAAGGLVKQTENTYDYQYARSSNTEIYNSSGVPEVQAMNYSSCKCLVKRTSSNRSDNWMAADNDPNHFTKNMTSNPSMLADIYYMSTGRVELKKTTEKIYSTVTPSQYAESATEYSYNTHNFVPSVVTTTQSNGDKNHKSTVYTGDSWTYGANQGMALHTLIQNNIINLPVATRSTVTKASDNLTYDLDETVTRYNFFDAAEEDIKPTELVTKRYNQPTLIGGAGNYYQGPQATTNPAYDGLKYFFYDNASNLSNVWTQFYNSRQAYIYDYDDKFITATIINAGSSGIYINGHAPINDEKNKTCYTSFETSKPNGWEITGSPAYVDNEGVTGKRAFVLGNNQLVAHDIFLGLENYTNATPYLATRLTFWATGEVTVTCGDNTSVTLVSSGPVINGYTFYEYKLASTLEDNQLQLSDVALKGDCKIDELRLYRMDARMVTATYDPLLGKTSECDENNRITYYEYDEKGRMRFIKDEKRNIIKMYEYNTATKAPPSCNPQIFSNLLTSEVFIKDDCTRGYVGTPVTYTIAAATYTSTVSQAVVDLQVQMDLATNGQAYANSHGLCLAPFYSQAVSGVFYKEDCETGYKGTSITYAVPAAKYLSTISQADADAQAATELNANGQAFANAPGNATCVIDTDPDWEGTDAATQCGTGSLAGHQLVQVMDINPNSPSYNTTQWTDGGLSAACGGAEIPFIDITYTNAGNTQVSVTFTNLSTSEVFILNMDPNTTTSTVAGFVPAGNYDVLITLPYGSNATNINVYSTLQAGSFHQTPVTVTTSANPIIRITL